MFSVFLRGFDTFIKQTMGLSSKTLNNIHTGAVKVLIAAGVVGLGLTIQTIRTMRDISPPDGGSQGETKDGS